jgi:hypothetical protein
MSLRPLLLSSSLLALLAAAPARAEDPAPASGDKVQLACNWSKGAARGFELAVDMNQTMNMGGMEIPTEMKMSQVWTETCDAVDDKGVGTVRVKFVRIHGNLSNPMMGDIAFDSDKPADEGGADEGNPMAGMAAMLSKTLTALANQEIEARFAANGEMVSMKAPAMESDPMGGGGFSADDMAKQMGALGKFPEKPVGVGDSWSSESSMKAGMGLNLKVKLKNTVQAIDAELVTVTQDGEFSTEAGGGDDAGDDPRAAMMKQMFEKLKITEGRQTGTIKLSRKDGRLVSSDGAATIKMEIPADDSGAGGPLAGGLTMEQKMKMKATRLAKLPEPAKKAEPAAPLTPTTPTTEDPSKLPPK